MTFQPLLTEQISAAHTLRLTILCPRSVRREKMTHGTVPWEGAGERRTLFYKV
jgi:hypothetical protein